MSNVSEDFAVLDKTNHKKMAAAVKAAMDADFKVEEKSLNDAERTFKRKSIAHFVKAKLSLEELRQGGAAAADTPAPESADTLSEPQVTRKWLLMRVKRYLALKLQRIWMR